MSFLAQTPANPAEGIQQGIQDLQEYSKKVIWVVLGLIVLTFLILSTKK